MDPWLPHLAFAAATAAAFGLGWLLCRRCHRRVLAEAVDVIVRQMEALETTVQEDDLRAALPVPEDLRNWAMDLEAAEEEDGCPVAEIAGALAGLADRIESLFAACDGRRPARLTPRASHPEPRT